MARRGISSIIRLLITADVLGTAGAGLIAPVFAVYVAENIAAHDKLMVVGFAVSVYWGVKSILQIPIARHLDRTVSEYDDVFSLILGSYVIAIVPFLYMVIGSPNELYLTQALFGIGSALLTPPWYAIFTKHVSRVKTNFAWSLESTGIGFSVTAMGATSGIVSQHYGFNFVFFAAGMFYLANAIVLNILYKHIKA